MTPGDVKQFELERIQLGDAKNNASAHDLSTPNEVGGFVINPTLEIVPISWDLSLFLNKDDLTTLPVKKNSFALVWKDPNSLKVKVAVANSSELLALKIIVEGIDPLQFAKDNGVSLSGIYWARSKLASKGIMFAPRSRLKRDMSIFSDEVEIPEKAIHANTFTLQWHITHACDLNCKHCYDRSERSPLTLEQGNKILQDLRYFCDERSVRGHVCFSGGNPFLHPNFFELYRLAVFNAFSTSILANPVSKEKLEQLLEVQKPGYFQVSLEGLEEHNDTIRGQGSFQKVIDFLEVLRELDISQAVMLTLTKDNIDQVILLAEMLRGHTEYFTFNRLSPVGSGADLQMPSKEEYSAFLNEYVSASEKNPIMGYKDNLINVELDSRGDKPFDGCTGFGCGAAFNFLTVLPDGDTHACRKFPSSIGNALNSTIGQIYDSELAKKYRRGTSACDKCKLRHYCGGCLSVIDGCKLDITKDKDPYCYQIK